MEVVVDAFREVSASLVPKHVSDKALVDVPAGGGFAVE